MLDRYYTREPTFLAQLLQGRVFCWGFDSWWPIFEDFVLRIEPQQLAVDVTLCSALRADGSARPKAYWQKGAAATVPVRCAVPRTRASLQDESLSSAGSVLLSRAALYTVGT